MKTKHTPGPWTFSHDGFIRSEREDLIAQVFDNPDTGCEPIGEEPSEYNMRLIAASPDLLAALEEIELCATQDRIASTIGRQTLKQADFLRWAMERLAKSARAAITKATQ